MQENENLRRNQGELELKINQEIQKAINSYESRVRQLNNENEEAGHRIQ
jgi:phage baseplate assembly protein W